MAMSIRVEFYGIPRRRAGVAETLVDIDGESARLGSALVLLGARLAIRSWRRTVCRANGCSRPLQPMCPDGSL